MSASTARAFENTDIAGLSRGVVAVDYGEVRREPKSLAFRKSIHTTMMKYGDKRNGSRSVAPIRHLVRGERSKFLLLGKPVCSFADFRKGTDVIRRKLAV